MESAAWGWGPTRFKQTGNMAARSAAVAGAPRASNENQAGLARPPGVGARQATRSTPRGVGAPRASNENQAAAARTRRCRQELPSRFLCAKRTEKREGRESDNAGPPPSTSPSPPAQSTVAPRIIHACASRHFGVKQYSCRFPNHRGSCSDVNDCDSRFTSSPDTGVVRRGISFAALQNRQRRGVSTFSHPCGIGARRRSPPLSPSNVSQPCSNPLESTVPDDGVVAHTLQFTPSASTKLRIGMAARQSKRDSNAHRSRQRSASFASESSRQEPGNVRIRLTTLSDSNTSDAPSRYARRSSSYTNHRMPSGATIKRAAPRDRRTTVRRSLESRLLLPPPTSRSRVRSVARRHGSGMDGSPRKLLSFMVVRHPHERRGSAPPTCSP